MCDWLGGEVQRIVRSAAPQELFERLHLAREHRELIDWLRQDARRRQQRRTPINFDIFHNPELIEAVAADFNHSCVYCERRSADAGVGHFRPLAEPVPLIMGDDKNHYAWLAYEWRNLVYSCPDCEGLKGPQFPVEGLRARYLATYDEVCKSDKNLLVDTTRESPLQHFDFLFDGRCFPLTPRGQISASELVKLSSHVISTGLSDSVAGRRHAVLEGPS